MESWAVAKPEILAGRPTAAGSRCRFCGQGRRWRASATDVPQHRFYPSARTVTSPDSLVTAMQDSARIGFPSTSPTGRMAARRAISENLDGRGVRAGDSRPVKILVAGVRETWFIDRQVGVFVPENRRLAMGHPDPPLAGPSTA